MRPRIVSGHATEIEQVPFQVALYDPRVAGEGEDVKESFFCGGVILDATHVLTAAHCLAFGINAIDPSEVEVLAGTRDLEEPLTSGGVEDPVAATSFDPTWNPSSGSHDVGVLTLREPLWSSAEAPALDGVSRIAPVPFAESLPPAGTPLTVSGWGYTEALTESEAPEAESGYPATLQSTSVPLVEQGACAADYSGRGIAIAPEMVCAGGESADACFGDSGGPLVVGPLPQEAELVGLVDFGAGCGQSGSPGVYQSVLDPRNAEFLRSDPPQAPLNQLLPSISGVVQSGHSITCEGGAWVGAPELFYRFFRDQSSFSQPFVTSALTPGYSSSPLYDVQDTDAGTRIFCSVIARNAGGLGEAESPDVLVAAAPQPLPPATLLPVAPAPVPAPSPPTLKVFSKLCRPARRSCRVIVQAAQGAGPALVTAVSAKLTFTRKLPCRRHGRKAICTRAFHRTLRSRPLPGGRFEVLASALTPGTNTCAVRPPDRAGIRQLRPTRLTLLLRAPRKAR
jgi:hypothetical protein